MAITTNFGVFSSGEVIDVRAILSEADKPAKPEIYHTGGTYAAPEKPSPEVG